MLCFMELVCSISQNDVMRNSNFGVGAYSCQAFEYKTNAELCKLCVWIGKGCAASKVNIFKSACLLSPVSYSQDALINNVPLCEADSRSAVHEAPRFRRNPKFSLPRSQERDPNGFCTQPHTYPYFFKISLYLFTNNKQILSSITFYAVGLVQSVQRGVSTWRAPVRFQAL
jgi:hypothetical protein